MRKSPDSLSKAILGERHGYQEYDQYPDVGEAVINDLSESQLAAFYGLKHHLARKLLFLRLGIGSKLPLSIHKAAVLLGMTVNDARGLEDEALLELADVLDSSDIAWLDKALTPSSPEEVQAEIEQEEKAAGRDMSDCDDPEDDGEEETVDSDRPPTPEDCPCPKAEALDGYLEKAFKRLPDPLADLLRKRLGIGVPQPMTIEELSQTTGYKLATITLLSIRAKKALGTYLAIEEVEAIEVLMPLSVIKNGQVFSLEGIPALEDEMTNQTIESRQPAATPETSDKVMSLEEIQAVIAPAPTPPVVQDEVAATVEPTTQEQTVEAPVEPPVAPEPPKPETPASPSNEARIQELEQSLTELQKSVKRLVAKNRDLLTRIEVLEHEGEEQAEKIKDFLGELDRREVIRMNAFTKAVDDLRAEAAQLILTKLPTDPPPQDMPAAVISIQEFQETHKHRAGPDGFFQAEGSSWGLTNSLARRLGIDEHHLKSWLASGHADSRIGLDCHGTTGTFYSWSDALHICAADIITIVPQDKYGLVKVRGHLYASQNQLAKRLHLYPKALLQRINPSVRSCLSQCQSGIFIHYRLADVQRVCADLVSKPRNTTPRKAQRAK